MILGKDDIDEGVSYREGRIGGLVEEDGALTSIESL